jgi:hypothetical protein
VGLNSWCLKTLETTSDFSGSYRLTLSEVFKDNGKVRITAELQNVTNESIYTGLLLHQHSTKMVNLLVTV